MKTHWYKFWNPQSGLAGGLIMGLIIVAALVLAGCTTGQLATSARLTLETRLADAMLRTGEPVNVVVSANLTDQEIGRVTAALDTYTLLRLQYEDLAEAPADMIQAVLLVSSDYAKIRGEYEAVRQIVRNHWDEYSAEQQVALAQYHGRAVSIDESVRTLLINRQRTEAVGKMLDLGLLIAQVVVL
jgi:hypothetical protein